MSTWVVFKKHTFEPANEVYFQYSFEAALDFMDYKNASTDTEWGMAEVFPENSWWGKLLIKLSRKGN